MKPDTSTTSRSRRATSGSWDRSVSRSGRESSSGGPSGNWPSSLAGTRGFACGGFDTSGSLTRRTPRRACGSTGLSHLGLTILAVLGLMLARPDVRDQAGSHAGDGCEHRAFPQPDDRLGAVSHPDRAAAGHLGGMRSHEVEPSGAAARTAQPRRLTTS